jgi:signal transduction histidine kinase
MSQSRQSPALNSYNLLLVEDNHAHARLITEILAASDHETFVIEQVPSLTEALEWAAHKSYDLVLLDLGLPESSGVETFKRFHLEAPTQPVVVLTSLDDELTALETVRAGAEDYLPKEQMSGSLCRTIRHAVERSRLSTQLIEREQQVRTIISRNLDGIVVINQQGQIQYSNAAALAILGVDGVERIMAHVRDTTSLEAPLSLAFDPDQGEPLFAEIRLTEISWGSTPCYLVSLRDITLRRQIEKNLIQTQKMEMIGTLASGIAHDFNNILTAISANAQMAAEEYSDAGRASEDLASVLAGVQRGNRLVEELLQLGRPRDISFQRVDLVELLRKSEALTAAAIRKSHALSFDLPDTPILVSAAPERLEQVVINLLLNARDATAKGGTLSVSLDSLPLDTPLTTFNRTLPSGSYARIEVKDTGAGIAPEYLEHIFEPFVTTKEGDKGTGLGLFIVSSIITQHEGGIEVASQPGRGTRFTLYLPLPAGETAADEI